MSDSTKCPICLQILKSKPYVDEHNLSIFECNFCGKFKVPVLIEGGSIIDKLKELELFERATIAYKMNEFRGETITLCEEKLNELMKIINTKSVRNQIENLIRNIWKNKNLSHEKFDFIALDFMGIPSFDATKVLLNLLKEENLVTYSDRFFIEREFHVNDIKLTEDGRKKFNDL